MSGGVRGRRRKPPPTRSERLAWMFDTMMHDDEKGKRLTENGNYVDRNLNDVRLNSQEIFYAVAYSNAEKHRNTTGK